MMYCTSYGIRTAIRVLICTVLRMAYFEKRKTRATIRVFGDN